MVEVNKGELISSTELTQYCLHGLDGLRRRKLRKDEFKLLVAESMFLTCDYRQRDAFDE